MSKRAGRKIYRTNRGNRKKMVRNVFKFLFIAVILAALVFVGYIVAKTVVGYLKNNDTSTGESDKPWTPPVFADSSGGGNNEDNPSENEETGSGETDTEENNNRVGIRFSAYKLPVTALASQDALTAALGNARESGYTAVIATLKDKGGKIYYKTGSEMAKSDEDAVVGEMYAGQICSIIKAAGFTPIAQINLLEDNNRYGEKRDGSYHIAGESTWLDDSVANGGKPWLSPFDTLTQSYAAYLSNEVSSAGFEYVIFDGVKFPAFRNSDLSLIGGDVQKPDRYKGLVNIANISANAAAQNNSAAITMVSAGDIISGTSEAFKPAELSSEMIGVTYLLEEISGTAVINGEEIALADMPAYEKAETVFSEIKRLAGEEKVIIPAVKQSEFSQADFSDTISAIMSLGFDSYIIL
ncbi:MAG: putative glycoside hydrolase [Ruminococcus sp.]|nr:putative glycoside hydrolase [Ruminococcus sp.]MCM1382074.1 putative glycoside hydrolase [Muribaculaceae bacterium]MCM1478893.1 putative glycoside hydrolase [Muribaculaceae bacterium]